MYIFFSFRTIGQNGSFIITISNYKRLYSHADFSSFITNIVLSLGDHLFFSYLNESNAKKKLQKSKANLSKFKNK